MAVLALLLPRGLFSCSKQGLLFVGVQGFSLWWLLLLRSTGSRTQSQWPHSIWNPPGQGTEPASPALTGRFLTTGSPGTSSRYFSVLTQCCSIILLLYLLENDNLNLRLVEGARTLF